MCHIMILFKNGQESLFHPNYFETCLKLARYSKTSIFIHELCLGLRINMMHRFVPHVLPDPPLRTLIKKIIKFSSWSSCKIIYDYSTSSYGEIFAHFLTCCEALPHIRLCNCSTQNFLVYEGNLIFFFISVASPNCLLCAGRREQPSWDTTLCARPTSLTTSVSSPPSSRESSPSS